MGSNVFAKFSFSGAGLDPRKHKHIGTLSPPNAIKDASFYSQELVNGETKPLMYTAKRETVLIKDEAAKERSALHRGSAEIGMPMGSCFVAEEVYTKREESKPPRTFSSSLSPTLSEHTVKLEVDIEDLVPQEVNVVPTAQQMTLLDFHHRADEGAEGLGIAVSRSSGKIARQKRSVSVAHQVSRKREEPDPAKKLRPSQSPITTEQAVKIEEHIEHVAVGKSELLEKEASVSLYRSPKGKGSSAEAVGPPSNWDVVIDLIRHMRIDRNAPVDLFGTHQLIEASASEETQKFHAVVAGMISSQTRDAVTAAAMARLHAMPGGLTVENIADNRHTLETLAEVLKPVGFYRQKASYLKKIADTLSKPPHNGSVPCSLEDLMKLPGVGPKVALLVLFVAFGRSEDGIIVDTNVRRVCSRLGWVAENATPEQTRKALEQWLPKSLWGELSFLFVGFGQQICKPVSPACATCKVNSLCPAAFFKQERKVGSRNTGSRKAVKGGHGGT